MKLPGYLCLLLPLLLLPDTKVSAAAEAPPYPVQFNWGQTYGVVLKSLGDGPIFTDRKNRRIRYGNHQTELTYIFKKAPQNWLKPTFLRALPTNNMEVRPLGLESLPYLKAVSLHMPDQELSTWKKSILYKRLQKYYKTQKNFRHYIQLENSRTRVRAYYLSYQGKRYIRKVVFLSRKKVKALPPPRQTPRLPQTSMPRPLPRARPPLKKKPLIQPDTPRPEFKARTRVKTNPALPPTQVKKPDSKNVLKEFNVKVY